MSKWLLLLPLTILGCSSAPVDTTDYRAIASAAFAVAVLQADEDGGVAPAPKPDACDCGGKGYIIHGDGHRTPCPCDGNCQCGKGEAPPVYGADPNTQGETQEVTKSVTPRRQYVEVWGAEWCGPCRATEPYYGYLQTKGWKVGDDASNHFHRLDFDANQEIAAERGITALPTYLVIVDGKVVYRHVGPVRDAYHLGDIYHQGDRFVR